MDTLKKSRQLRHAKIAAKVRRKMLNQLTPEERKIESARHIQAAWRAYKARKAARVVKEWRKDKETFAAVKLQAIFRARTAKRIVKNRHQSEHILHLEKLEEIEENEVQFKPRKISREERRKRRRRRKTMQDLRSEVRDFQRLEAADKAFLLRPNTAFSVWWKIIRVSVIGIEILQLIIPRVFSSNEKMSVDELLSRLLSIDDKDCGNDSLPSPPSSKNGLFGFFKHKSIQTEATCTDLSELRSAWITASQYFIRAFVVFTNTVVSTFKLFHNAPSAIFSKFFNMILVLS